MKNILICGSPRVGKTNLAKKISIELGYIYIIFLNLLKNYLVGPIKSMKTLVSYQVNYLVLLLTILII